MAEIVQIYSIFLIPSSVDDGVYLGCFHILAIVNNSVMNIRVLLFFKLVSFITYIPRNGIAGLYGSSLMSRK